MTDISDQWKRTQEIIDEAIRRRVSQFGAVYAQAGLERSPMMCNHANEVPASCDCPQDCYCRVRGTCVARCGCGHWPSDHMPMSGRHGPCRRCGCADYALPRAQAGEATTMGQVAPQAPLDGRVPRDEYGRDIREAAEARRCECGHDQRFHRKGDGPCAVRVKSVADLDSEWCACEAYRGEGAAPPQADHGGQRAMRLRE